MAFRTTFANLSGPQAALSLFDNMFNDLAGEIYIPCTAAGTNSIVLTPFTFAPVLAGYTELCGFAFKAAANATGPVLAQVGALGSLPVYLADGVTQANSGNVLQGQKYGLIFSQTLNSNNGGFFLEQPSVQVSNAQFVPGSLGGFTLSNDGGSPNTVLDIAAGAALNSTNATLIRLSSAFTKNTSGAWVVGSGNAGMGSGLTIQPSTWYYVFAIINAGVADVYFDTSSVASNAPAGTSAFRRIGCFRTTLGSAITTFQQTGNLFEWRTRVLDVNNGVPVSGNQNNVTVTVPQISGIIAKLTASVTYISGGASTLQIYPFYTSGSPSLSLQCALPGAPSTGEFQVVTNSSAQI